MTRLGIFIFFILNIKTAFLIYYSTFKSAVKRIEVNEMHFGANDAVLYIRFTIDSAWKLVSYIHAPCPSYTTMSV